jgi:ribose transport system ATP-binding protein
MGAGRSEFVRALYGVDPFESGEIYFEGRRITKPRPADWITKGVALITENRREEGLLMPKSVRDNLVLANLEQIKGPLNSVSSAREDSTSDWAIEKLRIRTYDKVKQQAVMLSGGNQQKTVVGKWLLTNPKVFLLDEPTRGIDVGAKYELYSHVNNLVQSKSGILFISSEMEELIGVCDRIMVMCRGRIAGELPRADYDQETLLRLAIQGEA